MIKLLLMLLLLMMLLLMLIHFNWIFIELNFKQLLIKKKEDINPVRIIIIILITRKKNILKSECNPEKNPINSVSDLKDLQTDYRFIFNNIALAISLTNVFSFIFN